MKLTHALLGIILISCIVQCESNQSGNSEREVNSSSLCDTLKALESILSYKFDKFKKYDSDTFYSDSINSLSAEENKMLWYRDIESPDTTKFTTHWYDNAPNNYYANHEDFLNYFRNRANIELAFQFGPSADLWGYHTFILKKVDCSYILIRSYYRHARFIYKAYAFLDSSEVNKLYNVIDAIGKSEIDSTENWNYRGAFIDNKSHKKFYIDFTRKEENNTSEKEITELHDFLDEKINWRVVLVK